MEVVAVRNLGAAENLGKEGFACWGKVLTCQCAQLLKEEIWQAVFVYLFLIAEDFSVFFVNTYPCIFNLTLCLLK